MKVISLLIIVICPSVVQAITFYHGEWISTNESCQEQRGKQILGIKNNNEFSLAMFCKIEKHKFRCEKSGSPDSRLSMTHGKISENGKLIIRKYEGFKPDGEILNNNASGVFSNNANCNGTWTASTS